MNSIEDVRFGIEKLDLYSKAMAEVQHNFHGMDDSDYSTVQRETLDHLYWDSENVSILLGWWADDISDWRILPVSLAHCYLFSLMKELVDLMPANHPKSEYCIPESSFLAISPIVRILFCVAFFYGSSLKPTSPQEPSILSCRFILLMMQRSIWCPSPRLIWKWF